MGKFEYFLSSFYLNKTTLKIAQTLINKTIKKAFKISSKCSNKILISSSGLCLPLLEARQKTTLINNFLTKIASNVTNKYIFQEIRAIQRQEAIWHCPLCKPEEFKQDNWILYTAKTAKEFKINLCLKDCPFQEKNAVNSIGYLLKDLSKSKKSLAIHTVKQLNLKFVEQLLEFRSSQKLTWNQLASHTGISRKGPVPSWFTNFKNPNNLEGSHGPIPNQHALFWFIHHQQIVVKIHKRSRPISDQEILRGKHYTLGHDKLLSKCPGCSFNNSSRPECTITFSSNSASSLWTVTINSQTSKYKLCNSINELSINSSNNESPLMSVNISNIPQTSQLLQELGYIHYYSLQLLKSEPIVNNHKIKLLNSGSPIGNLLQVIRDIISWCPVKLRLT
jgi:hypothetical protein